MGQEMHKRSRKHLVIPDHKEGIKESYQMIQEPSKGGSHWPKMGQFNHQKGQ